MATELKGIVLLHDGVRGHLNQSRGVARAISRRVRCPIFDFQVPELYPIRKFFARKIANKLETASEALEWLDFFAGTNFVKRIMQALAKHHVKVANNGILIISAGSAAAPFNLALSIALHVQNATIMTPTYLGTAPFDFAIVPEHDAPDDDTNIFVTMGAPNMVEKENLQKEAKKFLDDLGECDEEETETDTSMRWSILIGGDDQNYTIDEEWIVKTISSIVTFAQSHDAYLYITTSRRTSQAAENSLLKIKEKTDRIRYILLASKDKFNPIPAMLGFSETVFVTDDSVNMVSEAITGGTVPVLLKAKRKTGLKSRLQNFTRELVKRGWFTRDFLWGVPRFDKVFSRLMTKGLLLSFEDWKADILSGNGRPTQATDFNEAARAADWILKNRK